MSQYIEINPYSSNKALLNEIVEALQSGKVIAYPTDSGYALGCKMGLKKPLQQIKKIRNLDDKHNFTLICRDLSEISNYAKVDNSVYRLLKRATPGSYTFILPATSKVPALMLNKSKKTIGIRIPDHSVPLIITEALGEPLLSTTFILPNQDKVLIYAEEFANEPSAQLIDYILETDYCGYEPTTVVDMTEMPAKILRIGSGDPTIFQ